MCLFWAVSSIIPNRWISDYVDIKKKKTELACLQTTDIFSPMVARLYTGFLKVPIGVTPLLPELLFYFRNDHSFSIKIRLAGQGFYRLNAVAYKLEFL